MHVLDQSPPAIAAGGSSVDHVAEELRVAAGRPGERRSAVRRRVEAAPPLLARRRPPVQAPARDAAHGARQGQRRVEPRGGVEVPALGLVGVQRRRDAAAARRVLLLPPHPLLHRLRAQPAQPVAAEGRADAADVRRRAVLAHAAARAAHRLHLLVGAGGHRRGGARGHDVRAWIAAATADDDEFLQLACDF